MGMRLTMTWLRLELPGRWRLHADQVLRTEMR